MQNEYLGERKRDTQEGSVIPGPWKKTAVFQKVELRKKLSLVLGGNRKRSA